MNISKQDAQCLKNELTQWEVVDTVLDEGRAVQELHRLYRFKSFEAAFSFMNNVVNDAITPSDHHPRWLNTYNQVEVWLSTFDPSREITTKDIKLAQAMEAIWCEQYK